MIIEEIETIDSNIVNGIREIIKEDCDGDDYTIYEQFNRLFVNTDDIKGPNLMLRFKNGENKVVTIARVEFRHKRKGNMTKLVNLLLENNYSIRIECALSEEIFAFMKRGSFLWKREDSLFLSEIGSDYKLINVKAKDCN